MSGHSRTKKSSLTQQQRNQKRQRATTAQLTILKREFLINPTPNAKAREEIGERIDMTERSVQIWFQNKRAKAKLYAKKQGVYPDHDSLFGRPSDQTEYDRGFVQRNGAGKISPFNTRNLDVMNDQDFVFTKTPPFTYIPDFPRLKFSCISVTIGNWQWKESNSGLDLNDLFLSELRGLGPRQSGGSELSVYYNPPQSTITYELGTAGRRFKIITHAKAISKINLNFDESNQSMGHMIIQLRGGPSFAVQHENSETWIEYSDFSEGKQISKATMHILTGPYIALQSQLFDLYSFQPSKVSSQLVTPPGSATIAFTGHSIDPESDTSRLGNPGPKDMYHPHQFQFWLDPDLPERNQTQSTPAILIQRNDNEDGDSNMSSSSLIDPSYLFESLSDNNDEWISPMWDNELLTDLRRNSQLNALNLNGLTTNTTTLNAINERIPPTINITSNSSTIAPQAIDLSEPAHTGPSLFAPSKSNMALSSFFSNYIWEE
jgi:Homeodomain